MSYRISVLECPNCAATDIKPEQGFCHWCGSALIISDFNSIYTMNQNTYQEYADKLKSSENHYQENGMNGDYESTLGMVYLRLGNTEFAVNAFRKAVAAGIQNPETYFYLGIAVLNGKRPFLNNRNTVKDAIRHIETALQMEKKGIYYFMAAFIEYDFYVMKHLRPPNPIEIYMDNAKRYGVTKNDIEMVFDMSHCRVPDELIKQLK